MCAAPISVARYVSDEFGVLLYDCDGRNAQQKAEGIIEVLSEYKFISGSRAYPVSASIGLIELNARTTSVEQALNAADAACYAAKDAGRNRVRVYRAEDETITSRRNDMLWAAKLRTAIEENRFVLFFQEIRSLSEALPGARFREIQIRYKDDVGTLVPPGVFIPAAEQYNVMPAIDRWVLKTTCEYLARNTDELVANEIVSINLSGTTLSDETFPQFVRQVTAFTGVAPSHLCF